MPICALMVDDCSEAKEYGFRLIKGRMHMDVYYMRQPDHKALIIVIIPIFYVLEWAIFNPLFRMIMRHGLRKAGYRGTMNPVNRLEVVQMLGKNQYMQSS